ncbi:hypothetical protein [Chitinibacter tainanensis]|uniref:hypothetical protein n=1 Tax=Chitinibacter tainanensis TaxID=230667 RepID=UPI002355970D|nr:hypothetical protein [Chitinibacter tainanensis]
MLHTRRLFTLCLLATLSAASAAAPPSWHGVWRGQVGSYPVTACLQGDNDPPLGLYYYHKHLNPIQLQAQDEHPQSPSRWQEGEGGARWQAVAVGSDGVLRGQWQLKGKTLAIQLQRVAFNGAEPCLSDAFNAALEAPPKFKSKLAQWHGQSYLQVWLAGSDSDNELRRIVVAAKPGDTPTLTAEVRARLLADAKEQAECIRYTQLYHGQQGYLSRTSRPELITASWYVEENNSGDYCGGAHPNYGTSYQTYRRGQAKPVEVWRWLNAKAVRQDGQFFKIEAPLRRLLSQAWAEVQQEGCESVGDETESWDVYPTANGLAFMPYLPHAMFACTNNAVISYRQLAPLLSSEGQAAINSIKAELR